MQAITAIANLQKITAIVVVVESQ